MFVINGKVWRVQMVRSDYPLLRQPNGRFAVGVCDYNYKIICISNRLKGKDFKTTLCHEIVHAAMFSYDIDIGDDEEEFIAEFIARYGHEIITISDTIFKQKKKGRY